MKLNQEQQTFADDLYNELTKIAKAKKMVIPREQTIQAQMINPLMERYDMAGFESMEEYAKEIFAMTVGA